MTESRHRAAQPHPPPPLGRPRADHPRPRRPRDRARRVRRRARPLGQRQVDPARPHGRPRPARPPARCGSTASPIQALSEDELALLRRHKIGFVFQSFQLLGNLTARENVLLPLELLGLPDPVAPRRRAARRRRPRRSAATTTRASSPAASSSASPSPAPSPPGPPILLADEPTGNLDGATGRRILEILTDLRRREGTTLVLVTHDPAVAALADRRIHLRDGRIEREETPERLEPPAEALP